MYKYLLMVSVALLLFVGIGLAEDGSEEDTVAVVEFTGVAIELFVNETPDSPIIWAVGVIDVKEGSICADVVNVTISQPTPGPWGDYDEDINVGDTVDVYGAHIDDSCNVTLQGSEEYYFVAAEEIELDPIDVVEVKFTGVATELNTEETPDASTIWTVEVVEDQLGNLCSDVIKVIVSQPTSGPWGECGEGIDVGDSVEVYGRYVPDTCNKVTLQGYEKYYIVAIE